MLYKLRIIVVEDEYRILNSIVRKINSYDAGCEVVATAAHGREALQLIDKHRPNVVITDIKMPVMDGLKLSEIVRENTRYFCGNLKRDLTSICPAGHQIRFLSIY